MPSFFMPFSIDLLLQQERIDLFHELLTGKSSHRYLRLPFLRDKQERRNTLYTKSSSQPLFLIHIYLINYDIILIQDSQILQNRSHLLAGTTPVRIKIDDTRLITFIYPFRSILLVIEYLLQELGLV